MYQFPLAVYQIGNMKWNQFPIEVTGYLTDGMNLALSFLNSGGYFQIITDMILEVCGFLSQL